MAQKDLHDVTRGRVLLPGDDEFEQACTPWNLSVRQSATAVVDVVDADDIAAVVRWAQDAGVAVVTQATGHGATGRTGEAILIRTRALDTIEIDTAHRVARVGAGVLWGQLQAAAAAHRLTGLAGSTGGVSVVGYTLGGGLSWFGRKYGWAADAVRSLDIVDADGQQVRVSAASDPELFWAVRGGGGDFGVVTAMEFELFAAPDVYGGRIVWPGARTSEVFDAYRAITATAPEELSLWFHRLQTPGGPLVAVDVTFLGEAATATSLLAGLDHIGNPLSDSRAPMSVADIGAIAAEPLEPSPGLWRTEFLTDLGADVAEILVEQSPAPLIDVQLRHLGGALARPRAEHGARGPVAEPYLLYLFGLGLPHIAAAVAGKQQEVVAALGVHVAGAKPYTLLTPGESAAQAFDDATLARLAQIKRARDPKGLFRSTYPVTD